MTETHALHQALDILKEVYGYTAFREPQDRIIHTLLEGGDALVLMPTGGGKSLCYQIPAMIRDGVGIVVSPLIALMQDQVSALRQQGVQATFINSTLSMNEQAETEAALQRGDIDLLYISPERLLQPRTLDLLGRVRLSLFAIDEAHCVSQWGHDFRPEYQQLSVLYERFAGVPRVALTATADRRTRQEIINQLQLHDAAHFISSFDRPNIHYQLSEGQSARDRLWRFIQANYPEDAGIVYCLSRKRVDTMADWLSTKGRVALPYHAGLSDEERAHNQARFLREEGVVMVATIAFGMGIDKPDVRFVAHLSLPKSIEAYYQETGRAGRDGKPASAWMAYGLQDVITLRQMMEESNADETYKRVQHRKLEAMLGLCEASQCRRQLLLAYFDETLDSPCGNCDNCRRPPETWDATLAARQALSAVYRTGQRFGVTYIIDVLSGKADERISRNAHDQLAVYGVGKELGHAEWRTLFRQLIAMGFLRVDEEGYGALHLTEKCRPVLRDEEKLLLRKQAAKEAAAEKRKSETSKDVRAVDRPLFDALRDVRLTLARDQGVPPYVIFHDTTLAEMARNRPTSEEEIRYISGVGEKKMQRYGMAFLAVIAEHALPESLDNSLSDTVNETLLLHEQGAAPTDIADQRRLPLDTVYAHFANIIRAGLADVDDVLDLDSDDYDRVLNAMDMLGDSPNGQIAALHDLLDGEFSEGVLRCIKAATGDD